MIIDRDKARNAYLDSKEPIFKRSEPIIELQTAHIMHQAMYTNKSSLTIAINVTRSIENYNQLGIDTRLGMIKMAKQLVIMTRNTNLDTGVN